MYCDPGANLQGINHAQFMGIWLFGILDISYLKLWIARVTLLSNEVLSTYIVCIAVLDSARHPKKW